MKLLSLNTWGGKRFKPLMEFVEREADRDIFCFQEVFHNTAGVSDEGDDCRPNLLDELKQRLPDCEVFYVPFEKGHSFAGPVDTYDLSFGTAIFIKKSLTVKDSGSVRVVEPPHVQPFQERHLQYVVSEVSGAPLVIANLHGLWIHDRGKHDTSERLEQSERVNRALAKLPGELVLCGDFNLNPDTESLGLLTEGRRDLIKEYGVKATRNKFFSYPDKFADYTIVSSGITVKSFEVPKLLVSDHLPMLLEFDLA